MKKAKFLILGLLIGSITMLCIPGMAANLTKRIEAVYCNIKVEINGKPVVLKDSYGHQIEPFIHNRTTYLPVRALADEFGYTVEWNNDTKTVVLKDKSADFVEVKHYGIPKSLVSIPYNYMRPAKNVTFYTDETPSIEMVLTKDQEECEVNYNGLSNYGRFTCTLLPPSTRDAAEIRYVILFLNKNGETIGEKVYSLIRSSDKGDVDISFDENCDGIKLIAQINNVDEIDKDAYAEAKIQEPVIWLKQ